ncbi:MAG: signal peptidase I [Bacteroidia bacterium]|nr:signal peptidase I [Bacteroidia bacterium]
MRTIKEWLKALVFALIAATFVNALVFKVYAIPTPSMEGTLLVGDRIFVSKFHYGAQTAKTPIQFPLAHQKLFGSIPSYSSLIQLPQLRLPGISKVKHGDKVVFNYPGEFEHPSDMRTYYIKRCIALPGDVVEIRDQQVMVNNEQKLIEETMQHSFKIYSNAELSERFFAGLGISEYFRISDAYIVMASEEQIKKLRSYKQVRQVDKVVYHSGSEQSTLYPGINTDWSRDNYGPLQVPHRGLSITIDAESLATYGLLIRSYEGNEKVEIKSGQLFIDGEQIRSYTFKKDYYFAMGDNRHNSADSRMWGFIPDDHIVGKALFVLWSIDKNESWTNFAKKIRFKRMLKAA